jgi:hypothetical protein
VAKKIEAKKNDTRTAWGAVCEEIARMYKSDELTDRDPVDSTEALDRIIVLARLITGDKPSDLQQPAALWDGDEQHDDDCVARVTPIVRPR